MGGLNRRLHSLIDTIADQDWLDPTANTLQGLVTRAFDATGSTKQTVADLLSGTWLGHPLHPVLTDVPLGAWTAALVLDLLDGAGADMGAAADATILIGLVGALAAALAGYNDWQYTTDRNRRLGTLHALTNSSATLLYTLSLAQRSLGQRGAGRATALLGAGVVTAGAYIGGELVSGGRVGVDHAPRGGLPSGARVALSEAPAAEDQPKLVELGGTPVVLVRHNGAICALAETCSHLGGPLSEGRIEGDAIVCPWHGSRFSLGDGSVLGGPATFPQPCYTPREQGGQIELLPAGDSA